MTGIVGSASRSRSAVVAAAIALPMALLFLGGFVGLEPLATVLRSGLTSDGVRLNVAGQAYVVIAMLLLPVALVVAAWPIWRRPGDDVGIRLWDLAAIAAILGLIALTWGDLAVEVVRCDVLGIPNCD